jgi:hypothetical protein
MNVAWLDSSLSILEQGISEFDTLLLRDVNGPPITFFWSSSRFHIFSEINNFTSPTESSYSLVPFRFLTISIF